MRLFAVDDRTVALMAMDGAANSKGTRRWENPGADGAGDDGKARKARSQAGQLAQEARGPKGR
jgi:hypothetical protein